MNLLLLWVDGLAREVEDKDLIEIETGTGFGKCNQLQ